MNALAALLLLAHGAAPLAAPSPTPGLHPPRTPAEQAASVAACGKGKPCSLLLHEAGHDAAGRDLTIAEVAGRTVPKGGKDARCTERQVWLLSGRGAKVEASRQLFSLCDDRALPARLTVAPNALTLEEESAEPGAWSVRRDYQLAPLRLLDWSEKAQRPPLSSTSRSWSWERFAGVGEWYSPNCDADGNPPDPADEGDTSRKHYAFAYVPEVAELPAGFADSGWQGTHLGACAVTIDGSRDRGFTTFARKPANAADGSFRAVRSGNLLFVEVTDDRLVGGADWHLADHLEVWLGRGGGVGPEAPCLDGRRLKDLRQWGIRVVDGQVFPGFGNPSERLDVEFDRRPLGEGSPTVRLKIALPPGFDRLSLVYGDTDASERTERVIASSKLQFGWLPSLGYSLPVPAEAGRCVGRAGALEPEPSPNVPAQGLLYQSP